MSKSIDMDIELNVDVEFDFTGGTKARLNAQHGNYLPGDPAHVSDMAVIVRLPLKTLERAIALHREHVGAGLVGVDISEALSDRERAKIEQVCYVEGVDAEVLF